MRLNPIHPDWYHFDRSVAQYSIGEYRAAAASLERMPQPSPWMLARLAACYARAGDLDAARRHMSKALLDDPAFSTLERARQTLVFEHAADAEHVLGGIALALAGAAAQS